MDLLIFSVPAYGKIFTYLWMGQVKMEHYFHPQQNVLLQIPHVLTLVNLHSNFVLNTCNISEDTFAFVKSVSSEKYVFSYNSNYIIVLLEHVLKFCV